MKNAIVIGLVVLATFGQKVQAQTADSTGITSLNPLCGCELNLRVSPSPATTSLTINHGVKNGALIRIVNRIGQTVYNHTLLPGATLAVADWPAGIYTILLTVGPETRKQHVLIWP